MTCQEGCHSQDSATSTGLKPVDTLPFRIGCLFHVDSVVLGQGLVEERVVGVEQVENRSIVAKHVFKEADRFFVHVCAKCRELWIEIFVLVVVLVEVAKV